MNNDNEVKTVDLPKTLTISRKKWLRGSGEGVLLQTGGERKMCCLGFLTRACGLKGLGGKMMPADLRVKIPGLVSYKISTGCANSGLGNKLAEINDDTNLTEKEREKRIREGFKKLGVKVKFVP